MPFKDVPGSVDFVAQEHDVLDFWKENDSFNKLRALRKGNKPWSFIDGPITANNPMGVHHGWGRTYKDLYQRFWAMQGRDERYQNGFDCQGLWVEVEVEKAQQFESKKDIEAFGLDNFVRECKQRVLRMAAVQTRQSIRLGYWVDWNDADQLEWLADKLGEDPSEIITVQGPEGPVTDSVEQIVGRLGLHDLGGSYFTMSNENNYMIWAMLKKSWENGWLYRGADVMPWCPRCATGISQHEIVTDGYAQLTHPSVTFRMPLRGRENEALLAWTTTPWTLSSNVAAAVGPELTYAIVKQGDETLYLSKGALQMLKGEYEVVGEIKGEEMVGWTYDGPFDDLPANNMPGGYTRVAEARSSSTQTPVEAHQVIAWDEVGEEEGTGIVHIAPGCGAEDHQLGLELGLPFGAPLDEEGVFIENFGWLTGMNVADVAKPVFEDLEKKGLLYRVRDYTHRYPICWRCKTPLVFRLVDEWFISMDELRHQMMDVTRQIRWIPGFGLDRELDWLKNMHDWMISKKRFWGLALPFWVCEDCGEHIVIGSDEELKERAVEGWDTFEGHTPHRPYIDAVKLQCEKCGGTMSRITDVGNPWLDAGIVPFSTLQYRTNKDYYNKWFPANWISESFPGQFRNWFYSLLAMSTVLENKPPFLENFSYATLMAEDGTAMHKSTGNMIPFDVAADKMGVDVMRWLYCAHKPENNLLFGYGRADEVRRQFLIPLWNVYKFFVTYAKIDNWEPDASLGGVTPEHPEGPAPTSDNTLDRWIVARLQQVVQRTTKALTDSDSYTATMAVNEFMDDLTNWYVRRSRPRFWKSEQDGDKAAAYATLYYVLVRLIQVLAPFVPFVTEVMYQNLVVGVADDALESVHHCLYPVADVAAIDQQLLDEMGLARRIASLGRGARSSENLKLRQPLAKAMVYVSEGSASLPQWLVEVVSEELNVKALEFVANESDLVTYRLVGDGRQLGPRLGKQFPAVRKALAGLDAGATVRELRAGANLDLEIDGETVTLTPDEVIIDTDPVEGLAVAADRAVTVAVDAVLTEALEQEGLVRDLVRQVQNLRRDADYQLDDRIVVGLFGLEGQLDEAIGAYGVYLQDETLAETLVLEDDGGDWDVRKGVKVGGMEVEVAVRR